MYETLIEIAFDAETCVVDVKSEIDCANADTLDRYVDEAAVGTRSLVVSLASCPYIDSSGIRPLLRFAKTRGDAFGVVAPRGSRAARIIDLMRLRQTLRVFHSLPEALAAHHRKVVPT